MHNSTLSQQLKPLSAQGEPFLIKLTQKQAVFLTKLLPLGYSLHPQRKKKGPKNSQSQLKMHKRTNLPSPNHQTPPSHQHQNTETFPISLQTPKKSIYRSQKPIIHRQFHEQSTSLQSIHIQQRKVQARKETDWRLQFIRECRGHSLLVRAYGRVFDRLEQHTKTKELREDEFVKAILDVVSDEKMRRTEKGRNLSQELKNIFLKHRNKPKVGRIEQSRPIMPIPNTLQQQDIAKSIKKPPPSCQKLKRRDSASSSSDLGLDFDLNQFSSSQPAPQSGDKQFLEAAFICQTLRKIKYEEAIALLRKYSIGCIDVLKIKLLSPRSLSSLKNQTLILKKKYPGILSDSSSKDAKSEESSFEIQSE